MEAVITAVGSGVAALYGVASGAVEAIGKAIMDGLLIIF